MAFTANLLADFRGRQSVSFFTFFFTMVKNDLLTGESAGGELPTSTLIAGVNSDLRVSFGNPCKPVSKHLNQSAR